MREIKINSLETINQAATEFLSGLGENKLFAFYGKMGAGKTTFISAICDELKSIDTVNSPTFSLVNEYHCEGRDSVFHFDFYRIENIEEAYDFGYEDYFYSGKVCFIEWPEKIESILPPETIKVEITTQEDGSRLVKIHN